MSSNAQLWNHIRIIWRKHREELDSKEPAWKVETVLAITQSVSMSMPGLLGPEKIKTFTFICDLQISDWLKKHKRYLRLKSNDVFANRSVSFDSNVSIFDFRERYTPLISFEIFKENTDTKYVSQDLLSGDWVHWNKVGFN